MRFKCDYDFLYKNYEKLPKISFDYQVLENKPSIAGIELSGDKSYDELGIASKDAVARNFETVNQEISSIENELQKTTNKIDTVIEKADLGIKNTASGDSIHLTDSADNKTIEFALFGKAKQKVTTGKSLAKITLTTRTVNGVTFTVNQDGSIEVIGIPTEQISVTAITGFIPNFSGIVKLTGAPNDDCHMYAWNVTLNQRPYTDETKTTLQTLNNNSVNKELPFYVEAGETYMVMIRIFESVATAGTELNCTVYPMLSIDGGEFEPYTGGLPSPNPDYRQEIVVSGADGSVEGKSQGKNWLKNTAVTQTVNDITFTVNKDGSIAVNGAPNIPTSINLDNVLNLEKGKTYVLTNGIGVANYPVITSSIIYKDGSSKEDGFATFDSTRSKITVTEDIESIKSPRVFVKAGVTLNNVTIYPMVRLESDTEEYEPYRETVAAISTPNSLAGIPVDSGGNYTDADGQQWISDEIVKYADGSGERIQCVKKFIFNGTETWVKSSLVDNVFYNTSNFTDGMLISSIPIICNAYIGVISPINFMDDKRIRYAISTSSSPIMYIKDSSFNTVDELKAALASKNIYGYYPLKEPIRTPLTAEEIAEIEKLQTFYPITNITNDSDCGMKVTYLADSKNYIDSKIAELATAMVNNI